MIPRITELGDEAAQRLALTSRSQALTRLIAAVAMIGAILLVAPWPLALGTPAVLFAILVLGLTLVQTLRPDSDTGLGLFALVILLAALIGPDLAAGGLAGVLRMLGAALALYVAHASWALAALGPAHAVIGVAARRAMGGRVLLALLGAVAAGLLIVWPIFALPVALWAGVPAAVGLVVLAVLLLPRRGAQDR